MQPHLRPERTQRHIADVDLQLAGEPQRLKRGIKRVRVLDGFDLPQIDCVECANQQLDLGPVHRDNGVTISRHVSSYT
jgi:hypothetical protein